MQSHESLHIRAHFPVVPLSALVQLERELRRRIEGDPLSSFPIGHVVVQSVLSWGIRAAPSRQRWTWLKVSGPDTARFVPAAWRVRAIGIDAFSPPHLAGALVVNNPRPFRAEGEAASPTKERGEEVMRASAAARARGIL